MEDNKIIQLFWTRDEDAIRETDRKYGSRLRSFSKNILWNDLDAEECVNDTYLRTWNKIPPERPRYLCSYLLKICRYVSWERLDYQKAGKRNGELIMLTEELASCIPDRKSLEQEITARELQDKLNGFLQKLPEEKRKIFVRRYWFADSITDIASRIGLSENNVKQSLLRTRQSLKCYLEKEGYYHD